MYRVTYDDQLLSSRNFLQLGFDDYSSLFALLRTPRNEPYVLYDITGHIIERLDAAFDILLTRPVVLSDIDLIIQKLTALWSFKAGMCQLCIIQIA